MPTSELFDYEPVRRSRRSAAEELSAGHESWKPVPRKATDSQLKELATTTWPAESDATNKADKVKARQRMEDYSVLKHGHGLSFLGLFLFTFLVYLRPYELSPSLFWLSKTAFWVALGTLIVFVPTQLGLENRLTIRTREVNAVLLFALAGLLSIPFALEPGRAYEAFVEYLKVLVMFVVMVNVVRTNARLMTLVVLIMLISCGLSIGALQDYLSGNFALRGQRIAGVVGGLFSNPNDLALHLVTFIPIGIALVLSTRGSIRKLLFLLASALMVAGIVATFSRGGFIGLAAVILFLAWKLAARHRILVFVGGVLLITSLFFVAPSDYRSRLATTNDDSLWHGLRKSRELSGATPGTLEAFLAVRGARTLALRLERAQYNAMVLAERLEQHPLISRVRYPGLPSHPTHATARRVLKGFGSIIAFDLRGGAEVADGVCRNVRLIRHATSLGAVESTIERRAAIPGQGHLPPSLLRLSVGIEDVNDLWLDIDSAIRSAAP